MDAGEVDAVSGGRADVLMVTAVDRDLNTGRRTDL